jgi:hypothetical protein
MVEKVINKQGFVGVLISLTYGHGWSSTESNPEIKQEMMMNKQLVTYVNDCRNKKKQPAPFEIEEIWKTQFPTYPLPELRGVKNLCVMWVERESAFKIMQMNGAEYIYHPCDDPSWVIA